MRYRALGSTGLKVSEVGMGCARLGGIFQNQTHLEAKGLLNEAFDAGINFYDTSDIYCQGESESLLGQVFGHRRQDVILASKVGYLLPSRRKLIAKAKPILRPLMRHIGLRREAITPALRGELQQDFTPRRIAAALEQSLRRLRTEYVDLYYLHSPPMAVLERGDFVQTLKDLKRAGKIRHYGVSCASIDESLFCARYLEIAVLQVRLNLLDQAVVSELLPNKTSVGIVARECLAGGILAKRKGATYPTNVANQGLRKGDGLSVIDSWEEVARTRDLSLAQLALDYVLSVDGVSSALVGMRTRAHLNETLEILQSRPLSTTESGVSKRKTLVSSTE